MWCQEYVKLHENEADVRRYVRCPFVNLHHFKAILYSRRKSRVIFNTEHIVGNRWKPESVVTQLNHCAFIYQVFLHANINEFYV